MYYNNATVLYIHKYDNVHIFSKQIRMQMVGIVLICK